jgi:hypothetical protein
MELKPVEIKKASEETARGEGQTLFGKMVKCDDFVYIFHGKRFAKRGAPVDKTFLLKQTLRNKFHEIIVGALTVSPFLDGGCDSFPFPSFLLDRLGAISISARHELLGGCRERGREIWLDWGFFKGVKAECGFDWGIRKFLSRLQIGSTDFTWRYRGVK